MKITQEFKDTKIGNIPKEWEVARLGDENITDLIMGQSPPSSTYNDKKTGLPFLQGNAEFGEIYPTPALSCSQPTKLSEKNDILLSVRAPVGDVNITPYKLCIGRGLAAIRPKRDKLDYLFLFYYLKFGSRIFESLSMGSTFKAIRKEEVEKFQLPLPPLPEQQKIVEILSTADEAIQKVDEAIEKAQRLKQGLMNNLLTNGIGHKGFKDTEIGRIPKEWEVSKMGDICEQRNEIIQPTREGITKFVGLEHIESGKTSITSFTTDSNVKSSKFKFHKGDILYGKLRPYLDKAVITDVEGICSTDLLVLNPEKTKSYSGFLIYTLHSDRFISHAISTTSGTNHPRTSWKAIAKFKLPLPPLSEQQKISEILSTVDNRLEMLREKKERLNRIKQGLMNDLLTGKKRVRLEA